MIGEWQPDWFLGISPVMQALLAGGSFTWGVMTLGVALVLLTRQVNQRLLDAMLGFAAGVMLAASFWSLLVPAIAFGHGGSSVCPRDRHRHSKLSRGNCRRHASARGRPLGWPLFLLRTTLRACGTDRGHCRSSRRCLRHPGVALCPGLCRGGDDLRCRGRINS